MEKSILYLTYFLLHRKRKNSTDNGIPLQNAVIDFLWEVLYNGIRQENVHEIPSLFK